jgi:hypothetical protein
VILRVLDLVLGLRVSEEEEKIGLDMSQHGERAYTFQGLSVLEVADLTVPRPAGGSYNGRSQSAKGVGATERPGISRQTGR